MYTVYSSKLQIYFAVLLPFELIRLRNYALLLANTRTSCIKGLRVCLGPMFAPAKKVSHSMVKSSHYLSSFSESEIPYRWKIRRLKVTKKIAWWRSF